MQGRHIKLVPADDKYLDFIYAAETDLSEKNLWSDTRNVPARDTFADEFHDRLEHYYFAYFIIVSNDCDEPLGFVYAAQYSPWDRHLYVTIYVSKASRRNIVASEAGLLMIDYLFSYYDLHKIYSIVYDYNTTSLEFQKKAGFIEEGLFREHRYYNGKFHDVHLMALYPDIFYQNFDKRLRQIHSGKRTINSEEPK